MIFADIRGKTGVPEDVLTSNCIELLSLLPDSRLIDFFSMSVNLNGKNIELFEYDEVEKIEFWTWLQNAGEPDILCILKNGTNNKRIVMIIEVKHGSGKSSYAQTEVEPLQESDISSDQLAKYWQAAKSKYDNVVLIYLTHHHHFPKKDVEESIEETGNLALIYWVSWFHFYQFVIKKYDPKSRSVESKIFGKLKMYLEEKGYTRFQEWKMPVIPIERFYHHIYILSESHSVYHIYSRLYGLKIGNHKINLQYTRRYDYNTKIHYNIRLIYSQS